MATREETEKLEKASCEAASEAAGLLDDEIGAVMKKAGRIDELKPETADAETYEELARVVREATSRNLSIAELKANVEALGNSAISIFREMSVIAGRI